MKQNAEYRKVIANLMYKQDYVKNELLPATRNVARHLRVDDSEEEDEYQGDDDDGDDRVTIPGDQTRNDEERTRKRKRPSSLLDTKRHHRERESVAAAFLHPKPQSSRNTDIWSTPAWREIQQLKEMKHEDGGRYWKFLGPINQLFNLFKSSDVLPSLPVRYKSQTTLADHHQSQVPSVLFVEFVVLQIIQHCAKLPRHANHAFEGGHYGDLHYATRALAVWYKNLTDNTQDDDDDEKVLSSGALDAYLDKHFHCSVNDKAVVFKPVLESLKAVIDNPNCQHDTYRYMPKAYLTNEGINYPTNMTNNIWPLIEVVSTVWQTTKSGSNLDLMQISIFPPIQRYTLWGIAVLSLLWALADVYHFKADLLQYLNTLPSDVFERCTSSELFPGLYMMLMTSRPLLREDRTLFGQTLDGGFIRGTPPIAYEPLQHYYNACFKCVAGGKTHKADADGAGSNEALKTQVEVYSEVLLQYCEILMNEIYKEATTCHKLYEGLSGNCYAGATKEITRANIFNFLKTGFISKQEHKTIGAVHNSAIARAFQTKSLRMQQQS